MSHATVHHQIQFVLYRFATILKSFKTLYTLPRKTVDAFLNSFEVFGYDWANEDELVRKLGLDYYTEVKKKVIDYYTVLNHLCAVGQVEKMYIPPAIDLSQGIIANQELFEKKMARDLGLTKGKKALDIGCGRGRIASHIASYTGAHVTGINTDGGQLEYARRFALGKNLSAQCQFRLGDLNEYPLPFEEGSFDAIYQIQVFSYAQDLERVFAEMYRILKPGGRISCLDWFRLDQYDPNNPEHVDLVRRIKPLIGAIGTPNVRDFTRAMEKSGFKIRINENASINGLQAPLIENADRTYTRLTALIHGLVSWKILPVHFRELFDRLVQDGAAFVEADRKRLVTTSHYIIAEK